MILKRIIDYIFRRKRPTMREALEKATISSRKYVPKVQTDLDIQRAKANAVSAVLENKKKDRH